MIPGEWKPRLIALLAEQPGDRGVRAPGDPVETDLQQVVADADHAHVLPALVSSLLPRDHPETVRPCALFEGLARPEDVMLDQTHVPPLVDAEVDRPEVIGAAGLDDHDPVLLDERAEIGECGLRVVQVLEHVEYGDDVVWLLAPGEP